MAWSDVPPNLRPAGLRHFGESAEAYIADLRLPARQRYAQDYLEHLRRGGPLPPHNLLSAAQRRTIQERLRNTGTSQDFARRAIGGTMGTFRRRRRQVGQNHSHPAHPHSHPRARKHRRR
jgi:hypothetical protein